MEFFNMLMSKQTIKQTTVRTTTKGFQIWLEGNDLTEAGFSVKTPYSIEMSDNKILLTVDPTSKRKVTNSKKNGQDRPIIDMQNKKICKFFNAGQTVTVTLSFNTITIIGE